MNPNNAVGRWTVSNVREVLTNPKHTGHMVWNRRATSSDSGKHNAPGMWKWSSTPSHEPLVTKEIFLAAQEVSTRRERSRDGNGPNAALSQARHSYRLRSYVRCALCGRRMFGKIRGKSAYYMCTPAYGYVPDGHPDSLWVREALLLKGIDDFFAERIFSPDRWTRLVAALTEADDQADREHEEQLKALKRAIADTETRRARLIRSLELVDDPQGTMLREIQARSNELTAEIAAKRAELTELEGRERTRQSPQLLDLIPTAEIRVSELNEATMRHLFEAFRLEVRYDRRENVAECQVTIVGDAITTQRSAVDHAIGHVIDGGATAVPAVPVCVAPSAGFEPAPPGFEGRCPHPLDHEGLSTRGRI